MDFYKETKHYSLIFQHFAKGEIIAVSFGNYWITPVIRSSVGRVLEKYLEGPRFNTSGQPLWLRYLQDILMLGKNEREFCIGI